MNTLYEITSGTNQISITSEGHSCPVNDANTTEQRHRGWLSLVDRAVGQGNQRNLQKGFTLARVVENVANINMM